MIFLYGNYLVVVWFIVFNGVVVVNVVLFLDVGVSFFLLIWVDSGIFFGRVDIEMLNEKEAIVIWLEEKEGVVDIKVVIINL